MYSWQRMTCPARRVVLCGVCSRCLSLSWWLRSEVSRLSGPSWELVVVELYLRKPQRSRVKNLLCWSLGIPFTLSARRWLTWPDRSVAKVQPHAHKVSTSRTAGRRTLSWTGFLC